MRVLLFGRAFLFLCKESRLHGGRRVNPFRHAVILAAFVPVVLLDKGAL